MPLRCQECWQFCCGLVVLTCEQRCRVENVCTLQISNRFPLFGRIFKGKRLDKWGYQDLMSPSTKRVQVPNPPKSFNANHWSCHQPTPIFQQGQCERQSRKARWPTMLSTLILSFKRRTEAQRVSRCEARGEGARFIDVRRTFTLKCFKINTKARF